MDGERGRVNGEIGLWVVVRRPSFVGKGVSPPSTPRAPRNTPIFAVCGLKAFSTAKDAKVAKKTKPFTTEDTKVHKGTPQRNLG